MANLAPVDGGGQPEVRPGAGGRWLVIAAACFWGTSATLARFVFRDHHVPVLTVVELRLGLSALLLGAWLVWKRPEALRIERRDWAYFVALAVFGLAAVQGSYYYSISVIGVGLGILIQYLAPSLLVAVGMVRGTRVSKGTLAAVATALAGTALLVGGIDPAAYRATPLQWAISFSTAPAFAIFIGYSKRGLRRYAPETVLFYTLCFATLAWAIVTPPWRIAGAGYSAELWGLFIALALTSTLIPFMCFNAGLKRMSAIEVGVLSTVEPVVAVATAALFLGETLLPLQNLGAVLVLCASILAARESTPD